MNDFSRLKDGLVGVNFHPRFIALLFYFIGLYYIAIVWYESGYFSTYNMFFDADPNTNLASLAHGWGWGRNAASHPLLEYFSIIPRVLVKVFSFFVLIENEIRLREYIALAFSPFFGCISIVLFYCLLSKLKFSFMEKKLLFFFYVLSFSNLIFSVLPESYSISSALIISSLYYYVRCKEQGVGSLAIWFLIGLGLVGVTISNIAVFCIVYSAYLYDVRGRRLLRAITEACVASTCLTFVALGLLKSAIYVLNAEAGVEGGAAWASTYFSISIHDQVTRFVYLIFAFFDTYSALFSTVKVGNFTFHRGGEEFFQIAFVVSFVGIALAFSFKYFKALYSGVFCTILVLIVLFNVTLHTFFGREMFLYSQHWLAATTIILAPIIIAYPVFTWLVLTVTCIANLTFFLRISQSVS